MTMSRPLPRAGAPCQAIWKVNGPALERLRLAAGRVVDGDGAVAVLAGDLG